jgi:acetolactate synthase-1/2/3 large subunit
MSTDTMEHAANGASTTPQTMTGAEIFVRALDAEGVDTVFGHPGGAVIKIYDAMERIQPRFEHVLVRHEQGGTHAAEGYAKATGGVGTVLVTSGPGATNTVTGIADAYMDSVPIVVFTGQVPTHLIGNDSFQETDTTGVTRSITKHNFLVRDVNELATSHARAGRARSLSISPRTCRWPRRRFPIPSHPVLAAIPYRARPIRSRLTARRA